MPFARRRSLPNPASRARPGEHAGLILNRYLQNAVGRGEEQHKLDLYKAAEQAFGNAELKKLYKRALDRWQSTRSREPIRFRCESPLIIGLGGENVTETGLTLHHTYGVPYLPGAALKGIAARYARKVWGHFHPGWNPGKTPLDAANHHRTMFGTQHEGGLIEFLDGWITETSLKNCLVHDVMTPHHRDYYMKPDNQVREPTDFDSPNPVPFLAVRGAFLIGVEKRDPRVPETWVSTALQLLKLALSEYGIGGKTNAGYGRLTTNVELDDPLPPPCVSDELPLEVIELHASGHLGVMSLDAEFAGTVENLTEVPAEIRVIGARFIGQRIQPGDDLEIRFRFVRPL